MRKIEYFIEETLPGQFLAVFVMVLGMAAVYVMLAACCRGGGV